MKKFYYWMHRGSAIFDGPFDSPEETKEWGVGYIEKGYLSPEQKIV